VEAQRQITGALSVLGACEDFNAGVGGPHSYDIRFREIRNFSEIFLYFPKF
jgi:hypothetical protein